MTEFKWDAAERVFWTIVQAALGVVTVELLDVPVAWAAIVAAVLATVKAFVARKVGEPDARLLPKGLA